MPSISLRLVALGSLVCMLLLTACGTSQEMIERDEKQRMVDSLRAVNEDLRDSLRFYDDIYSGQFFRDRRVMSDRIRRLEFDLMDAREGGRLIESLRVDALFEPASAALTAAGRSRVAALAEKIAAGDDSREIRVEGHADNVPVSGRLRERYPSNWELSAARAAAIVRALIDAHGMAADRLAVVSYGDARPVVPNTTAESRRTNRRIRVTALPAPRP
ncbi:MAG: OmpA family protein [Bacteroidetes bacterium]|jgi:chemotaxis protein MotB|nr:OmpA family protein [Bacteroidota bacterium]